MKIYLKIQMPLVLGFSLVILLSMKASVWATESGIRNHPNILMIICDDLNHWVGHLGRNNQVQTPNIDRLASQGISFANAYCASPQCNPSRASFFSGKRPFSSGVYANSTSWKGRIDVSELLTTHFQKNGYHVVAAGKVHTSVISEEADLDEYGQAGALTKAKVLEKGKAASQSWSILDGDDDCAKDEKTVQWITKRLGRKYDKPFFMIAGLHKPHLSWDIPKKYYDQYPLNDVKLPPIKEDDLDDLDMEAVFAIAGRRVYAKDEPREKMQEMVRGYLAAVSYCDEQVGRILMALKTGPNSRNTIIMLWGDHGYHLGEKHMAAKRLLWEEANRAPYIWIVPGITPKGMIAKQPVDFMTGYPTLCELAGLTVPKHVQGKSIVSLLNNPDADWNEYAMSTYHPKNHTIRTEKWRYIRYANGSQELYDHTADLHEWVNLAHQEKYADVIANFSKLLPTNEKPFIRDQFFKNEKNQK